jgi:hypothetical protein
MKLVFLYISLLLLSCASLSAQIMLPAYQAIQYKGSITVTTAAITNNTDGATATSGGTVAGFGTVTARGICWSTDTGPTTSANIITSGSGLGTYTSELTGLSPATLYYVRAYATVAGTTTYGNEVIFTTPPISTFYTTGSLQYFTVPTGVTSITIEAAGGNGASSLASGGTIALGGIGATIKGTFAVTPGTVLELLVGDNGITNSQVKNQSTSGGGGGGSWVLRSGTLLLVAGGGGGGSSSLQYGNAKGSNATVNTIGSSGTKGTGGSLSNPATVYTGGNSGNGGNGAGVNFTGAGAGGGWLTNGEGIGAGKAYPGAPSQGISISSVVLISGGGYGGGGGGLSSRNNQAAGGGGGGGYSGGGSSSLSYTVATEYQGSASGGGGSSFNSGTIPVNIAGITHAQPYIKIIW